MEDLIFGALKTLKGFCVRVCVCVPPVTDFTGGEAAHCPLCPHTLCIIMFPVGPYKSVRAQLKIAFSMTTPTSTHVLKREKEEEKTHTHKNTVHFFVECIFDTTDCRVYNSDRKKSD